MDNIQSERRLIIVGGAPRSGTTLLQNMLDSHPEILGGPEFLHLADIVGLRRKLCDSIDREWIDLICDKEQIDGYMRDLIKDILLGFADRHGAMYLSEKSPMNILVFPELLELLPEAKFIRIVRDPRATIASLLKVGERAREKGKKEAPFTVNVEAASRYVKRCFEAGHAAAQTWPERVFTVLYEDLVRDPETHSRNICNHLGIEWSPAMCDPGSQKHLGEKAITEKSQELWYDKSTYYSNPTAEKVDKWKESLSGMQLVRIQKAFAGFEPLETLGYDLAPSRKIPFDLMSHAVSVVDGIGALIRPKRVRQARLR